MAFDILMHRGVDVTALPLEQRKHLRSLIINGQVVKVINYQRTEVIITGFTKKDHSWLLGYPDGDRIRPIGTMGLGITLAASQSMWPVFQAYKSGEIKYDVYVQLVVRCKVKYRDWYKSGAMRLPVFEEFLDVK